MIVNIFRTAKRELARQLSQLERKIIVGGENLLEKAEEQEKLLEESNTELAARKARQEELQKALQEKEVIFLRRIGSQGKHASTIQ